MISVANPIYDAVFKYLMEDERVAKTLISALLKREVEEVLSVFDQTHKDKSNRQVLNIDEEIYSGDEEMNRIIHRLLSAASDAKLRQDMNVEDEYFTAIENRDTAIMLRDKKIAERDAQLAEQGAQLAEQGAQLAEQGAQLAEQGAQLAEKDGLLAEKDMMLSKTIKMLLSAGLSIETIAVNMNIDSSEVERLSKI